MNKIKKICSAAALFIACFSLAINSAFAVTGFKDVKPEDWCYDAVQYAVKHGMVNGTSPEVFSPKGMMTKAQFITILGRLEGVDQNSFLKSDAGLADVPSKAYYGPYARWAYHNNLIALPQGGSFHPEQSITREEIALILARYLSFKNVPLADEAVSLPRFTDVDQLGSESQNAVETLIAFGIIVGDTQSKYQPEKGITRAEGVTVFMRLAERLTAAGIHLTDNPLPAGNPAPSATENASAANTSNDDYLSRLNAEILRLINLERNKAGLSPITYNLYLQPGATIRALDCKTKFSHTRPNGESYASPFKDAVERPSAHMYECLYKAARSANSSHPETLAALAVSAWMTSGTHSEIIMTVNGNLSAACGVSPASGQMPAFVSFDIYNASL